VDRLAHGCSDSMGAARVQPPVVSRLRLSNIQYSPEDAFQRCSHRLSSLDTQIWFTIRRPIILLMTYNSIGGL